jgi:hypothetical protein
MANFGDDTRQVKEEYEGLSNSTQVFVWCLVGLGVVIGLLLGGAVAYGIAVEEVDGRDCIEYEDDLYCLDEGGAPDDAAGDDAAEDDGDEDA